MKILELKEKRASFVQQARELIDRAEAEKREMTAEEEMQYDRLMAEIDKLGKAIEREERLAFLEKEISTSHGVVAGRVFPVSGENVAGTHATPEYRSAFLKVLRYGNGALDTGEYRLLLNPEVRALAVSVDAAGGYLVPTETEKNIVKKLETLNVFRRIASVVPFSGTKDIPVEGDIGSASWVDEGATFTESDVTFGRVTIEAHKLGTIIKVSEELLLDAAFDLEVYLTDVIARRFAKAEEAAFVAGDGVNKPLGVIKSAGVGVTTAVSNAITADEVIDLFYSVEPVFRQNATFLMNDTTAKVIRKLKDSDGQYIWQPGLAAGEPDKLLGRPVVYSNAMPSIGAGNEVIAFGDFTYYLVGDRQGRVVQRLNELFAATGQVGFRAYQRVDGKLTISDAVKVMKMASI